MNFKKNIRKYNFKRVIILGYFFSLRKHLKFQNDSNGNVNIYNSKLYTLYWLLFTALKQVKLLNHNLLHKSLIQ